MNASLPIDSRRLRSIPLAALARLEAQLLEGLAAIRAEHARRSPFASSSSPVRSSAGRPVSPGAPRAGRGGVFGDASEDRSESHGLPACSCPPCLAERARGERP